MMNQPNPLSMSINVSKLTLDAATSSDVEHFRINNDSAGFDIVITEPGLHRES